MLRPLQRPAHHWSSQRLPLLQRFSLDFDSKVATGLRIRPPATYPHDLLQANEDRHQPSDPALLLRALDSVWPRVFDVPSSISLVPDSPGASPSGIRRKESVSILLDFLIRS